MKNSIYLVCLVVTLYSCGTSKSITSYEKFRKTLHLAAWNEDTANPWQFSIHNDDRFIYYMRSSDSTGATIENSYTGFFRTINNKMTLFFDEDRKPEKIDNYIIEEVTGNYLIQPLKDGSGRVYLRIVYPNYFR
jgi:hypothetical protein